MKKILVDTSVWVDHFRHHNDTLTYLLEFGLVMMHPLILGELACGTPPHRHQTLLDLGRLPPARQAGVPETMAFIEREHLFGLGCGLIDILLLTSALMTPETTLWTLDKRLHTLAERFGVSYQPVVH